MSVSYSKIASGDRGRGTSWERQFEAIGLFPWYGSMRCMFSPEARQCMIWQWADLNGVCSMSLQEEPPSWSRPNRVQPIVLESHLDAKPPEIKSNEKCSTVVSTLSCSSSRRPHSRSKNFNALLYSLLYAVPSSCHHVQRSSCLVSSCPWTLYCHVAD